MVTEPTTYDFRLQRKAVKDILSKFPDGIDKDELARLAEAKGIDRDLLEKALASLLNVGTAYYDKSGKIRFVRKE
ncbi:MAG: hypothetical protein LUQ39_01630 [Methanomassiliicoccales archaeon]|nr:hypothetical protein [Methanomassiliicoccales archaeon]